MALRKLPNKTLRLSRDGILFAVGLLGIGYETLVANGDRPTLLVLFGAMVGLPAFLRQDEKKIPPALTPTPVKPAEPVAPIPPAVATAPAEPAAPPPDPAPETKDVAPPASPESPA